MTEDEMNKIDVLEELLPSFQCFLNDLTTCKLTSALEAQVNKYNQNIQDYVEQHVTVPSSRPPDPPKVGNEVPKTNTDAFIAEQRALSRSSHVSKDDSYYNVQVGTGSSQDAGIDNFYEPPTITPPVPTSSRPKRVIDDDPDVYENPDEEPVIATRQGRSSTMPQLSGQTYTEPEASDSGGTLFSFQSTSSSQPQEELQDYEDLPDADNFDDDSWGSTDYEDYDDMEIEKNKTAGVDANLNKTKPNQNDAKSKMDKLAQFKKQYEPDSKVDHIGILYTPSKVVTISKRSFGQWAKRYCVARDMHLLGFKNPDSKSPAIDLVLFGNTVTYVGLEGRQQNVFTVSHPSRSTEMFSAETKADAEKWIEILKGYATMGNELTPSTGFIEKENQGISTHTGDDLTRKVLAFFKRDKKGKGASPQLSIDEKGVLAGYINIMGAKHGESKWRKKFMRICTGQLECHSEDGDTLQFEFSLKGTEMMPADQKVTKRKTAMKISRENETLIYFETLNHLDMGPLLKKFMDEIVDQKEDPTSTKKRGMVSSIMRLYEKHDRESADQEYYDDVDVDRGTLKSVSGGPTELYENFSVSRENDDELYTDVSIDQANKTTDDAGNEKELDKATSPSIYQNFKIVILNAGRKRSTAQSPKLGRAATVDEPVETSGKKDKKTKKEKKVKKDKKGKGKDEVITKEDEIMEKGNGVAAKEAEGAATEAANGLVKKRMSVARPNMFKESDKSHLLDVDRLEIERKDVDARKREVTKKKIDLRAQKRETTDPKQKELLEAEILRVQQEWSECSNRLAFINNEIERFTKGGDGSLAIERKQDSASAEIVRNGISERTTKKEPTKPGNVADKLKMFQNMGNS